MIRREVVQKELTKLGIVQSCQYTNVGSHRQLEAWKKRQIQCNDYPKDRDNDSYDFVLNKNGRGFWGNDGGYREDFYP